jgi:hypothetical protein
MTDVPSLAEEIVRNGTRATGRGSPWKGRTHCGHGHEFTPENTLRRGDSSANARRCRECKRQRSLDWYYARGKALRASRRELSS